MKLKPFALVQTYDFTRQRCHLKLLQRLLKISEINYFISIARFDTIWQLYQKQHLHGCFSRFWIVKMVRSGQYEYQTILTPFWCLYANYEFFICLTFYYWLKSFKYSVRGFHRIFKIWIQAWHKNITRMHGLDRQTVRKQLDIMPTYH